MALEFRPLVEADLHLMHAWLNEPGVVRWWEGDDVSFAAVVDDYGPDNDEPYEHWIAMLNDEPVGWIQCAALADFEPDEAAPWLAAGIDPAAAGIDYLIGAPSARGKGLGGSMIDGFVTEIVFGKHPWWVQVAADPYEANIGSWKALEKAGFVFITMLDNPGDADGPSRLMARSRS